MLNRTSAILLLALLFPMWSAAYEVGDLTDDWILLDPYGTSYSLYDYEGKIVLVNLFKDT